MTKPVTIPNIFATATTAIPLSQLDSDFSTVATALNDANTYSNYAADTGVANAYVVTLTGVSTTYSAGLRIQFKAGASNTGASTLNVNGGGTKNITFQDASALSSGTIAANAIVDVMYDGTQFLLMNDPAGTVGTGDVVGPAGATANAAAIFDSTTGKLIKDSKVIITPVANSSTLTIANNKTVTVNNTLTLSGTDSTTMTFPSTSATIARTDSAQTFTGVQTFSSNPVLSGGTANGVLYLNGSKVATSGSALVFDGTNLGLGVTPSAWGSGRRILQMPNGAAFGDYSGFTGLSQNYFYNGSADVYIANGFASRYLQGNGQHLWYTAANNTSGAGAALSFTQAMTLDAGGSLGVGITGPAAKLDVSGTSGGIVYVRGTGDAYQEIAGGSRTPGTGSLLVGQGNAGEGYLWNRFNSYLSFGTNNTERARIDSSGNLGLGVTPSAWGGVNVLQIARASYIGSDAATDIGANFYYDGTNFRYLSSNMATRYQLNVAQGTHAWFTAPSGTAGNAITFTQAMTLDASGNLGVGTTSPTTTFSKSLHVYQTGTGNAGLRVNAGSATGFDFIQNQLGEAFIYNRDNSYIAFGTNNTERARIDSSGNLLVGTTSSTASPAVGCQLAGSGNGQISVGHDTGALSGYYYASFAYNSGVIGSITQNGTTGVLYNITSDYRLKNVIGSVTGSGERIDALEPVDYTWKADGSTARGFLAHKFQEVYPNSVTGSKDEIDTEGNPVYQAMQASSSEVIADLVAEIQSLRQRVALLEGN